VNTNFDLGVVARPGDYKLQDETYAYWLGKLAKNHFVGVTADVRREILAYSQDPNAAISPRTKEKERQELLAELAQLKATATQDHVCIHGASPPT